MPPNDDLRCSRCGKLSAKASSLKRHYYYCRSKPSVQPKSRKRCCEACTQSKRRCDARFPACSSCTARNIACQYIDQALPNLTYTSNDLEASSVPQTSVDNALGFVDDVNSYALDVASDVQTVFDFNILSTAGAGTNLDAPVTLTPSSPYLDMINFGFDNDSICSAGRLQFRPISPISLQWKSPKVLGKRTPDTPQAQMATMMLAQIIASFPYMMTNKETFPPFIHPRCYDYSLGRTEMSEILKDCMGLAHMFVTKKRESNKVFWRSVRMEQEKLFAQYQTYTKHELQAAAQAILIYTTMRLIDGDSGFDEIEIPLLHSLGAISNHLGQRNGEYHHPISPNHNEELWQDWILAESRLRLVNMARIMNLAFYMDHAFSCAGMHGFALIPLPCNKIIWETSDECVWNVESEKCYVERAMHGLTGEGKLVRLRQTAVGIDTQEETWQKWLASQDGFGILVMLASQLLA